MERNLLKLVSPLRIFSRTITRRDARGTPGAVQYPGIRYYPRHPDQKDPDITPSKLLMITRIKPIKGSPWWDRIMLKEFKLDDDIGPRVVKNIPEVNAKLWKIKHMIRVQPVVFPYGEPTERDIEHTVVLPNGHCVVKKELRVPDECIEAKENFDKDARVLEIQNIIKETRLRWLNPWSGGY